jgi:uncharacterized protein YyaL (SSP411 family)
MIKGLADAYAAFGENSFIEKARRAADFIIDNSISPKGNYTASFRAANLRWTGFWRTMHCLSGHL